MVQDTRRVFSKNFLYSITYKLEPRETSRNFNSAISPQF
jgi:hypothetical protein